MRNNKKDCNKNGINLDKVDEYVLFTQNDNHVTLLKSSKKSVNKIFYLQHMVLGSISNNLYGLERICTDTVCFLSAWTYN